MRIFSCAAVLLVVSVAQAQEPATAVDWQQEIQKKHEALVQRNGPGTNGVLRDQLLTMKSEDQEARGLGAVAKPGQPVRNATNLAAIDQALTDELKQIVKTNGWPTIAQVGIDASNAAMTVLNHTQDHDWQKELMPHLLELATTGQIDPALFAIVVDKELMFEGKPQRYGTQFKLVDGQLALYAVEDPGILDRLRLEVLLPPLDAYKANLAEQFHLKVSNKIVSAPKP